MARDRNGKVQRRIEYENGAFEEFIDDSDNLPGSGRQPLEIYITENLDAIANFRKQKSLPEYKAGDAKTGTVATVTLQGETFYGVNSGFDGVYTLSLEERRALFNTLKDKGKMTNPKTGEQLQNLGQAEFLSHAEAEVLIKAKKAGVTLPKEMDLFVDRVTCARSCQKYLGELMTELGIEKINIYWRNQTDAPFIIKKK